MLHLPRFLTPVRVLSAVAASLCLLTPALRAANTASDNASNYGNGWASGTNGGTGFGPWTLNTVLTSGGFAGQFLGDSTYTGARASDPNNNPPRIGIGNPAFGSYSDNQGSTANSLRSFTGGALSVGQTFNVDLANGYLSNGGTVGFQLLTTSDLNTVASGGNPSATRFQYLFYGGQGSYRVNGEPGGSEQLTQKGFTDNGMHTSFTLTGTDTFTFTVSFNDGGVENFAGTLGGTPGTEIDGVRFLDNNVGGGSQNDFFFNNLSITGTPVPEPGTVFGGLCILLIFGGALLRRGPMRA